jgi:hypothetical protein
VEQKAWILKRNAEVSKGKTSAPEAFVLAAFRPAQKEGHSLPSFRRSFPPTTFVA